MGCWQAIRWKHRCVEVARYDEVVRGGGSQGFLSLGFEERMEKGARVGGLRCGDGCGGWRGAQRGSAARCTGYVNARDAKQQGRGCIAPRGGGGGRGCREVEQDEVATESGGGGCAGEEG